MSQTVPQIIERCQMLFDDLNFTSVKEWKAAVPGRKVIGFMSGNQQHPDMMCEVFILAPTDLLDAHEIPAGDPTSSSLG